MGIGVRAKGHVNKPRSRARERGYGGELTFEVEM
jgi:hypothetical protein